MSGTHARDGAATRTVPPGAGDAWVLRPRPRPQAHLRLFLLPHAGAGASAFRGWSDGLPADVEVCPVQLPGRENRVAEPAFDRLEPLVRALAGALAGWDDLPWAVFGHSNGALIAFELARHLRREGRHGPVHLFASGRRSPDSPAEGAVTHHLPDGQFVRELRELGGTPEEVMAHPELMALLLPLLRADVALTETYPFVEEAPLECPITAYGGVDDAKASREQTEAWRRHTSGGFTHRRFPGDHFFILSRRDLVLRTLSQDLLDILMRGA